MKVKIAKYSPRPHHLQPRHTLHVVSENLPPRPNGPDSWVLDSYSNHKVLFRPATLAEQGSTWSRSEERGWRLDLSGDTLAEVPAFRRMDGEMTLIRGDRLQVELLGELRVPIIRHRKAKQKKEPATAPTLSGEVLLAFPDGSSAVHEDVDLATMVRVAALLGGSKS